MATSKTVIANMAISHLGSGKEISDLETERSQEANACRRFYDNALAQTLRDFRWPFATKIAELTLSEANPTDEWAYSYVYPTDCKMFRKIVSSTHVDSKLTRIPYRIVQGESSSLIYTDQSDAIGEYTKLVTAVERYPDDFVMTLSLRLAAYIAPRLTAGDPFKLGPRAMQMYFIEGSRATANAAMEEQPDEPQDSEFILARNT